MHKSCLMRIQWWFENYSQYFADDKIKLLDVGGTNINGGYHLDSKRYVKHVLDIADNEDVDICVKENPYHWDEVKDETYDIVVSYNSFQHIEYFWCTLKEIYRVLKKKGFFVMIAPSNRYDGMYPTACWAFNGGG